MPRFKDRLKRGISILKKIILVLTVYMVVVLVFTSLSSKGTKNTIDPIARQRNEVYSIINDKKLNSNPMGREIAQLYKLTSCSIMGEGCTDNPEDGNKYFKDSLMGHGMSWLMFPYANPPASGVYWVYSGLKNANLVPSAYAAQGIGLASLQPLSGLWTNLRNAAYIILVFAIITVGFMIMFRLKINPQTVITLQNSLPRIVITMILITFSFAIAGFLIDLMYIVMGIAINVIGSAGGLSIAELQGKYFQATPADIFTSFKSLNMGKMFWALPNSILSLVPPLEVMARLSGGVLGGLIMGPWLKNAYEWITDLADINVEAGGGFIAKLSATLDGLFKGLAKAGLHGLFIPVGAALGFLFLVPAVFGIVLFIALIVVFLRIFILLISAYIRVLFLVILAPFYLLREVFPSQSAFPAWIRSLITELATFPVVVGIFIFATVIVDGASSGNLIKLPFLYGIDPVHFATIMGMWFLYATPDIVRSVRKALSPKETGLPGFGVFFGGVGAGLGAATQRIHTLALLAPYSNFASRLLDMIPGVNAPQGRHGKSG